MTSRHKLAQAGFTLVELAIVLLIVGLLISGILKGQEMIQNSRMTATIQQIKSYEAAVNTFRDSFGGLPGDLVTAQTRVPGCTTAAGCVAPAAASGGGNGIIGAVGDAGAAVTALNDERVQFWLHLALANLITGVAPNHSGANAAPAWGTTLPAGRFAGGFTVGYANATANGSAAPLSGHYLVLQGSPTAAANATTGGAALAAARAAQMDLKLDDGQPATGDAIAFSSSNCITGSGVTATYDSANQTTATCSIGVRIMN